MATSRSRTADNKTFMLAATFALSVWTFRLLLQNQALQKQIKKLKKKSSKVDGKRALPASTRGETSNKDGDGGSTTNNRNSNNDNFSMTEMGRVESPFPQRAGCPRQGTVAPHVKSRLILHATYTKEIVDGLEDYSHVWIFFCFHLNPRGKAKAGTTDTSSTSSSEKKRKSKKGKKSSSSAFTSTKIQPPRAPHKMGVLATRAPHRPNPIGLSLALLEKVDTVVLDDGRKHVCLWLGGLDLVDGTPVYDIKPYVPWDRIPTYSPVSRTTFSRDPAIRIQHLQVPDWVGDTSLALPQITWSQGAILSLRQHLKSGLDPLYDHLDDAKNAITEIVASDPRAKRDGRGKATSVTNRATSSTKEPSEFEFTFGRLRVAFQVDDQGWTEVSHVQLDQGDLTASPGSYPHNLALRRRVEALSNGAPVLWKYRLREGDMGPRLLQLVGERKQTAIQQKAEAAAKDDEATAATFSSSFSSLTASPKKPSVVTINKSSSYYG